MYKTASVTLGRNVDGVPVSFDEWQRRKQALEGIVRNYALKVHTVAQGYGEWEGQREESFIVVFDIYEDSLIMFRAYLGIHVNIWQQDAIALVVGTTDLVS